MHKNNSSNANEVIQSPMLYLGWANLNSKDGGGYNVYTKSKLADLSEKKVYYLSSKGKTSLLSSYKRPCIQDDGFYLKTKCFRIDNNPIFAPTTKHYSDNYLKSADLLDEIYIFIKKHNITDVHIQSHEGFPLQLISFLKKKNTSLNFTIYVHDAFYVCPKVHLYKHYTSPCFDNNKGKECASCARGSGHLHVKTKEAIAQINGIRWLYTKMTNVFGQFTKNNEFNWSGKNFNSRILKSVKSEPLKNTLLNSHRSLISSSLKHSEKIICFSHFYKEILSAAYPELLNIEVQRIDLSYFNKIRAASDIKKTRTDKIHLCYWGSSNQAKGLDLLLEALRVNPHFLKARLHIHLLLSESSFAVKQLKLDFPDDVSLKIGFSTDDLAKELSQIDISVVTSRLVENSPLTLLEAKSAHLFCIAPDSGGVPEFVTKETSVLFESNSVSSLDGAISLTFSKIKASLPAE